MAFQTVKLDPPISQTLNGVTIEYVLEYDFKEAKVRVIETGTNKATPDVIYTDGDWTKNSTILALDARDKQRFHEAIQTAIREEYGRRGSALSGGQSRRKPPLPPWAAPQRQGIYASSPATTPISSNGEPISYANPTGTSNITTTIATLTAGLFDPMSVITQYDVTNYITANERNASIVPLIYPIDMSNLQDRMVVQCYSYQPPTREGFIESRDDRSNILTKGLKRGTALKYKVGGGVILPMPNTVKDSSSVSWETDKLNNLSAAAAGLVSQNFVGYGAGTALSGLPLIGGLIGGTSNLALQLKLLTESGAGGGASAAAAGLLSGVLNKYGFDISPETLLARGAGLVPNSNMELMFRGPQMRQFNYQFQFTCRSPQEANRIRQIIRYFKEFSAAKKDAGAVGGAEAGDPSFFLGTPNIFTIRYVTENFRDIPGVNIIKPCALTRFETDYTPQGSWQAFDKGQPVSYKVQMDFAELEPIYNTDYNQNVNANRVATFDDFGNQTNKGDLRKINDDHVGY